MFEVNIIDKSYWTLDVIQTASYEILLVRLSVCPSLNFLKIGSIVFHGILHDDSFPWYLATEGGPEFGPNGVKSGPELGFSLFSLSLDRTFSLKLYTTIACNNV